MDSKQLKTLKKTFKKHPDAFWKDIILLFYKDNKKIAFSKKSIESEFNRICQEVKGGIYFNPLSIDLYIRVLLNSGCIEETESGKYKVTESGFMLYENGGFTLIAERKRKESRRFDFEYFTMGWDTLISLLALLVSAVALFISLKR